jgi:hypothetical protein
MRAGVDTTLGQLGLSATPLAAIMMSAHAE